MFREDMPECCGATVLCELRGMTEEGLQREIQQAKKDYGVMLATTARQPEPEELLRKAGFKMTGSGKSNHGAYAIKVWVLDLKGFGKKKALAAKKKAAAKR